MQTTEICTEDISGFLRDKFSIEPISIALLRGYSNQNYSITDKKFRNYILRIARPNRTYESVVAEEHVLCTLKSHKSIYAPRLINSSQYPDGQRFVHLFEKIPGDIECLWWQQCSIKKLKQIFNALAILHHDMAIIPKFISNPTSHSLPISAPEILEETRIGVYVREHWTQFRTKAYRLQQDMIKSFPWKRAHYQWIHGDVHLENVLFQAGQLTGFLDFELVCWDACEKDVILSAFRVCKEGKEDNVPFQYDQDRFKMVLDTYLAGNHPLCMAFFTEYETLWKPYFCLDQTKVYLTNAFEGVWKLEKEIGFLPCFNEVLQYQPIGSCKP